MANVAFVQPKLLKLLPIYQLIRACLDQTVKEDGIKYLPMPDSTNTSSDNVTRYNDYKTRAVFYNIAGVTLTGLVGQIFTNDPDVSKLPEFLKPLLKNSNGRGIGLVQSSKEACSIACSYSRLGLLIDYPTLPEGQTASRQQLVEGEISPTVNIYGPDAITNWDWKLRGSQKIKSLVVLQETYQHEVDEFEREERLQYRVLRLESAVSEDGNFSDVYVQLIYRQEETDKTSQDGRPILSDDFHTNISQTRIPVDSKGDTFNEIPFEFIGGINNDMDPDPPAFRTLCDLNTAHYRNSADYEESVFTVGQPTFVVSGLTEAWLDKQLKGIVKVGSRNGLPLPRDADAKILQVAPNVMAKEAMDQKEAQMKAIGAKLIEPKDVQQTATEVKLSSNAELSFLATVAKNVSEGFQNALVWCCRFVGALPTDDMFKLNTDFAVNRMDANERSTLVNEWLKEAITTSEMRAAYRKSAIATLDDKEYEAEISKTRQANDTREVDKAAALAKAVPPQVPFV